MMSSPNIFALLSAVVVLMLPAANIFAQQNRSVDELEKLVVSLEHRVQQLKAMGAVENLQRMYGYYVDKKMWDEVAGLFTEDGTYEMAQRGVYVGKARIRLMLETLIGPAGGELFNHMQVQPIITVADDGMSAKMRVRSISQTGKRDEQSVWSGGLYENEYVNDNGVWKIKKLHFYNTFAALYDGGWTRNHLPVPGMSNSFPPDRPPSETFESFPHPYLPPYHYNNPVTNEVIVNPIDGKEAMQ